MAQRLRRTHPEGNLPMTDESSDHVRRDTEALLAEFIADRSGITARAIASREAPPILSGSRDVVDGWVLIPLDRILAQS